MNYDFLSGSEEIKASEELRGRVRTIIIKDRCKRCLKASAGALAGVIICGTAALNTSGTLAYAMRDVPVINRIVRVVTFGRYEQKIGGSEADIVTPRLEGLANAEIMERINSELGENAEALKREFEAEAAQLYEDFGDDAHMGIEYDYIIRTDTDDYLAIDVYYLNIVGSSSTTHKFYTVDKSTGELVTLGSLFNDGADYVTRISDIVRDEMHRINDEEEGMFFVDADEYSDGFTSIDAQQNFFINADGKLVICFDKYEVAAGAQGCPEFVIDTEKISDILKQ